MDTGAISFGTDGWRATTAEFTDERVRAVAQAVADYLHGEPADYLDEETGEDRVIVGYDPRSGSEGFAESVATVLAGAGFDVILPERDRPTPLVAYAIRAFDARGAVMITASHNPPSYNGVKFIPSDAAPALPAVTDRIEANLRPPAPRYAPDEPGYGEIERRDLRTPHADHAIQLVTDLRDDQRSVTSVGERLAETTDDDRSMDPGENRPTDVDDGGLLSGMQVAYDAMHGSGRGVTDELLSRAGADVERLRCETDPTFGGTPPEPSAEHLAELTDRVRNGPADLGIANDGDADRIAVVTPERGVLDPNLFFAATYDALLTADTGPAIRTVSTTFLVDRVAAAYGEQAVETAVGFKWVAQAMAHHDALIGGEESGGFSVRGHVREKDGALIALLAAVLHAEESYDDRLDRLTAEHGKIAADKRSLDCPDHAKAAVIDALGDAIPETVAGRAVEEVSDVDGFKLLLDDGSWVLVRPSGTEPKLRVYAESDDPDTTAELLEAGCAIVEPVVERHR